MRSVTATEIRAGHGALLTRVEHGDQVTITRHGRAVAVLVRPDALRSWRTGGVFDAAAHVHDLIAHASGTDRGDIDGLSVDRADELVREIRAGRDAC